MNHATGAGPSGLSALSTLLAVAAGMLVTFNLGSLLAPWHWLAELTVHFAAHYLVAALLLGTALLLLRRWRWALVCAAVIALNAWRVVPGLASGGVQAAPAVPPGEFRLLQWNVSVRHSDPEQALAWILEREPNLDMVVLLEVSPRWKKVLEVLGRFYPHHLSLPRDDAFGIAVFSRLPDTEFKVLRRPDSHLPSIVSVVHPAVGQPVAIWALHAPPPLGARLARERNSLLESIARVTVAPALPMVVVGDLNVTPYSPWFARLQHDGRLVPARPVLAPTWAPVPFPSWLGLPIDHLLTTSGVIATRREPGPRTGSDHRPVVTVLRLSGMHSTGVGLPSSTLRGRWLRGPSRASLAACATECSRARHMPVGCTPGCRGAVRPGAGAPQPPQENSHDPRADPVPRGPSADSGAA